MSICAALAAKTKVTKAEKIAANLAQATQENARLCLPEPFGPVGAKLRFHDI